MLKISLFFPLDNLARWSWEFYEDKMIVKTKSLTVDYENEIQYDIIKVIRSRKWADLEWLSTSFVVVIIISVIKIVLNKFDINGPIIDLLEKSGMLFALVIMLPSFGKHEHYSFLDAEKNYLTTIKVNNKNRQSLLEAIKLIKRQTEITSETYVNSLLPETPPNFHLTEYDLPDYLNKAQIFFYEDRLISVEKNLVDELTLEIKYDELNGKVKVARLGNNSWNSVWCHWLYFVCIVGILITVFFPAQVQGHYELLYAFIGSLAPLFPLYLLKFVKREMIIFQDKKDNGIFWMVRNSANREKLQQIVEFIQSKVTLEQ
jgi:hypothetical protein